MPRVIEPSDKLLDLIYDAASEQELWRSVLTEIADLTGSQGGALFGQSFAKKQVYFDYTGRLSDECNRAYQARHISNLWSETMVHQPAQRIVYSDEAVPVAELKRTAFYDEVLHPQDVVRNAMIALAVKRDFHAAFNLCRSERQGAFGDEERKFLERLAPHLNRSLEVSFRLEGYQALQRAEYGVLDRLAAGMILLDRRSRVIYTNSAARAHGAESGALRINGAGVATRSISHSARLGRLIEAALNGAVAGSIGVPRVSDGQLLTVLVLSLRGKDVGRFADVDMPDAAALLYIIDPANRASVPIEWITDAYGLTRAEARVALAASSGNTVNETALMLGLSANTVKTHLRRVFAKTGTARQAELARLMTSIGLVRADGEA